MAPTAFSPISTPSLLPASIASPSNAPLVASFILVRFFVFIYLFSEWPHLRNPVLTLNSTSWCEFPPECFLLIFDLKSTQKKRKVEAVFNARFAQGDVIETSRHAGGGTPSDEAVPCRRQASSFARDCISEGPAVPVPMGSPQL